MENDSTACDGTPVSIVGYSLRAPNCSSVHEFAEALKEGRDLTTSDTRYPCGLHGLPPRQGRIRDEDLEEMNPSFFGMSRKQAEKMDPALRLLLKVCYEALLDANINIASIRGSRTGVYAGHCFCDMMSFKATAEQQDRAAFSGYETLGTAHCMAANRISYFFDLKGPSMTIDTACSSSLLALDRATRDIKAGIIERAIVCGVSLCLDQYKNAVLIKAQMLSPTGHCHVFDDRADGYCRADGIGCVVLEKGTDGYAMVVGSGTNQDGATSGITYPNADQQVALMSDVFAECGVSSKDVCYHEAHGTGTVAGDKEELAALSRVFHHPLTVGSVKSNMGHSEGASGLMGLSKILLMFEDQLMYPNHDFQISPHGVIKPERLTILKEALGWTPGLATISNFGFGGSNAFAVLQPCPRRKISNIPDVLDGRPFSCAPSKPPATGFADFYALQRAIGNDKSFRYEWRSEEWCVERSPLVFICDGQGSQWNDMGKDLMQTSAIFRSTIERLECETGISLVHLYEDGSHWNLKANSAVGIVSFQLGVIAILEDNGVRPDYFLGHSLGELACAYLAGYQTEAQVLLAAKVRSELVQLINPLSRLDVFSENCVEDSDYEIVLDDGSKQQVKQVPADTARSDQALESFSMSGKMVVVGCDADMVANTIQGLGLQQTCIACFNSPKGQTISGPANEVSELIDCLKQANQTMFVRDIDTNGIAYHAPYLRAFRGHLRSQFWWDIAEQPLPPAWISTSSNDTFGVGYLIDNICKPVYFQQAIELLPNNATVIEIGPGCGLLAQVKRTRKHLQQIRFVERQAPVNVSSGMELLKPWMPKEEEVGEEMPTGEATLHHSKRYPNVWGRHTQFFLPRWENFERFEREFCTVKEVAYDLSSKPWSSIRDHTLRGQTLFPAAGYLHVLWSSNAFEPLTEVKDFKVLAPLVIPKSASQVKLMLHRTGQYCEIWDASNETCHASGTVLKADSHGHRMTSNINETSEEYQEFLRTSIGAKHYYCSTDSFGPAYQNLDKVTANFATLRTDITDFVAYLDAFLQQLHIAFQFGHTLVLPTDGVLFFDKPRIISFPRGIDRVVFWEASLEKADRWLTVQSHNTVGNSSILVQGLRNEYVQAVARHPVVYSEQFVEYGQSSCMPLPSLIAAALLRESLEFAVVGPIHSPELQSIVEAMQKYPLSKQSNTSNAAIVFSNEIVQEPTLLVTTESDPKKTLVRLVAKWGAIHVYRISNKEEGPLEVVKKWKDAPASGSFVWAGSGSSGAAASLNMETGQRVLSYPPEIVDFVGAEKRMRQNFFHQEGGQLRHGVWVDVKRDESALTQKTSSARLRVTKPGVLDAMEWVALDPNMYPVQVATATMNFRDVVRATGLIKEPILAVGLEFSGYHTVQKKRVFGLSINAIATHCYPTYSYPTPDHLSDKEAATIPMVYLTVYYALFEKALLQPGNTVLIHAGTGGIGMAAVRLAQRRGAEVFATCSSAKRKLLKDTFGLDDDHIGDSRSDAFVQTVLDGTGGIGVDIVLNQLAGPLQIASLRCLAPCGHFCEIGKFDAAMNSPLGQSLLAQNVSYHVIDLMDLLHRPDFKAKCDRFLSEGFANNEIEPLPTTEFDASNVVSAFRCMSRGKHTGKILITGLGSYKFPVRHLPLTFWRESHLITGGLGGVGLALASRLANHGSRDIILVGRSGVTTNFQRTSILGMERLGCQVRVLQCDLLDLTAVMANPDRIWHVATVYRDVTLENMTDDQWNDVVGTKVGGYHHLRACWPTTPLVNISSVSGYFGNVGQTNYAFANSSLDSFARQDANTVTIRLGSIDNVGYIIKSTSNRRVLELSPFQITPVEEVLDRLEEIVSENKTGVFSVYNLKPKRVAKSCHGKKGPYMLKDTQAMLANVLGGQPDQYYPSLALKTTGLDSLSMMEVMHHVAEESGGTLSDFKPQDIDDNFTIQDLVDLVVSLRAKRGSITTLETSDAPQSSAGQPQTAKANGTDKDCLVDSPASKDIPEPTSLEEDRSSVEMIVSEDGHPKSNQQGSTGVPAVDPDQDNRSLLWSKLMQERKVLVAFAVLGSAWYLISWAVFGPNYYPDEEAMRRLLPNASVVLNGSMLVYLLVVQSIDSGITKVREPVSCSHSILSILVALILFLLYLLGGPSVFVEHWEWIMLGYYAWDLLWIGYFWDALVPDFREFYMVHHSLFLYSVGGWRVVASLDEGDGAGWQDNNLALCAMIWFTSPLWLSSVSLCRHFGILGPKWGAFLSLGAFCVERLQELSAFVIPIVSAYATENGSLSPLIKMMGLSAVVMEVWEIFNQQRMLRKQFLVLRRDQELLSRVINVISDLEMGVPCKAESGSEPEVVEDSA